MGINISSRERQKRDGGTGLKVVGDRIERERETEVME